MNFRETCICPDLWCPVHAVCGMCETRVIILDEDEPAFCPSCGHDVMPKNACRYPYKPEGMPDWEYEIHAREHD